MTLYELTLTKIFYTSNVFLCVFISLIIIGLWVIHDLCSFTHFFKPLNQFTWQFLFWLNFSNSTSCLAFYIESLGTLVIIGLSFVCMFAWQQEREREKLSDNQCACMRACACVLSECAECMVKVDVYSNRSAGRKSVESSVAMDNLSCPIRIWPGVYWCKNHIPTIICPL